MTRYSIEPRVRIFVKRYGFLSFAKNMSKYIGKILSKTLRGKYSQKFFDHARQSVTNANSKNSRSNR